MFTCTFEVSPHSLLGSLWTEGVVCPLTPSHLSGFPNPIPSKICHWAQAVTFTWAIFTQLQLWNCSLLAQNMWINTEDANETPEGVWILPINLKPVKCVNANAVNHSTAKIFFWYCNSYYPRAFFTRCLWILLPTRKAQRTTAAKMHTLHSSIRERIRHKNWAMDNPAVV